MGTPTRSREAETDAWGFPKGVRPLRGDRTRGLAPFVGAHEAGFRPSGRREEGILETVCPRSHPPSPGAPGCAPFPVAERRACPLGCGNLVATCVATALARSRANPVVLAREEDATS